MKETQLYLDNALELQQLLKKIEEQSKGDFKRNRHIKNCLRYVVDNFDELEPLIKRHWIEKEKKQIISSTGTGKCKNAFNGTDTAPEVVETTSPNSPMRTYAAFNWGKPLYTNDELKIVGDNERNE